MNHDYEHCLDYNIDCPEECFRGQLVKDLKSSNQCMEVSWMSFEGTDECMKRRNTMPRYIDADRLKADLYNSGYCNNNWLDIEGRIDHQPTADVVEVVRCKDCKHKPNGYTDGDVLRYPNFPHEENNPCPCQVHEDEWYSWIPNDDFYCSYGERADT